jgi:hypothetical protein
VPAPSPPAAQPLQMPKLLPLLWMKPQVDVMWASCAADSPAGEKGFSAGEKPEMVACSVVLQARAPGTNSFAVTVEALQVGPAVAIAWITRAVAMGGVSGLLSIDCRTEIDCKPLGVTMQVQHEISSSAGSKA